MDHQFTATVEGDLTTLVIGLTVRSDPEAVPRRMEAIRAKAKILKITEGSGNKYTYEFSVDDSDLPATLIVDTRGMYAMRSVKVERNGAEKPILDVAGMMKGQAEFILKLSEGDDE